MRMRVGKFYGCSSNAAMDDDFRTGPVGCFRQTSLKFPFGEIELDQSNSSSARRSAPSILLSPTRPTYALLVPACILCFCGFCAPAACVWKRLEHTGLFPPMATIAHISSSQAAAEDDIQIFPTKAGGTEQRTL
jgi:hypothetical protein